MRVDINAHYLTSAYTGTGHTRTHDGAEGLMYEALSRNGVSMWETF